jgi:hypothetical protein
MQRSEVFTLKLPDGLLDYLAFQCIMVLELIASGFERRNLAESKDRPKYNAAE